MAVPPGGTAGIRAELSGFPLGNNLDALSAVLTKDGVLRGISVQSVASAEGTDGVIGKSEHLPDFYIAMPLQTQGLDLLFFIVCHSGSSSLRPVSSLSTADKGAVLEKKSIKKEAYREKILDRLLA